MIRSIRPPRRPAYRVRERDASLSKPPAAPASVPVARRSFPPRPAGGAPAPTRSWNPQHFDALVEPLLPRLVAAAHRLLPSEDQAWDAVQEALERIWRRGWLPAHPLPALLHLVHRSCLYQLRTQRRRSDHEALSAEAPDYGQGDPLHASMDVEQSEAVHAAVQRLRPPFRSVVRSVDLDGLCYEEASARLGIPLGTLRSRLFRARRQLREELAAEYELGEVG